VEKKIRQKFVEQDLDRRHYRLATEPILWCWHPGLYSGHAAEIYLRMHPTRTNQRNAAARSCLSMLMPSITLVRAQNYLDLSIFEKIVFHIRSL